MKDVAMKWLAGVGDRLHEWHEWSRYAFHVRRRLTVDEQQAVGEAIDLRGTEEGRQRFLSICGILPDAAIRLAERELS